MNNKLNNTRQIYFLGFIIVLALLVFKPAGLHAQKRDVQMVELSGILLSSDSLKTVADARILSKDNFLGSFSDSLGQFNIIVNKGDSLMFSSMGYDTRIVPITDSILRLAQPITFLMTLDTVLIHEVVIHAFWDYATFKQMIIHMKPAPYISISKELDQNPLLYQQPNQSLTMEGPIQALYDMLNSKAVLQRKLIKNRKDYNREMIKLGRPNDTIPTTLDYMREKQY